MSRWDDRLISRSHVYRNPCVAHDQNGCAALFWGSGDFVCGSWQSDPQDPASWSDTVLIYHHSDSIEYIEAITDGKGRINLFFTDYQGHLRVFVQAAPNDHHHWQQVFHHPGFFIFGTVMARDMAAAVNSDGRAELFYRGTNNNLYHIWQQPDYHGWSDEKHLGDDVDKVMAALDDTGQLNVMVIGANDQDLAGFGKGHLYSRRQGGGAWSDLEQPARHIDDFTMTRMHDGRIALLYSTSYGGEAVYLLVRDPVTKSWLTRTVAIPGMSRFIWAHTDSTGHIQLIYQSNIKTLVSLRQLERNGSDFGEAEELAVIDQSQRGFTSVRMFNLADGRLGVFFRTDTDLYYKWQK